MLDLRIRELLGADRIAQLLLLLKELDHAPLRLHQNAASGHLKGGHDLLKTGDDGLLGLAGLDEVGACQLLYRAGHRVYDLGLSQDSCGFRGQGAEVFRLLQSALQNFFQAHAKKLQCPLRLDGGRNGAFVLIVEGPSVSVDELLPADEESHSLDKLGQLPAQAQTLPLSQQLKQDLVHLFVGGLIELGPLVALG